MKRLVLSPKYLSHLDYAIFLLKQSFVKVVMGAGIFYCVRIYYLSRIISRY